MVEKELNRLLLQDNKTNENLMKHTRLPISFPPYILEHIKTRCCSVLARKQRLSYFEQADVLK